MKFWIAFTAIWAAVSAVPTFLHGHPTAFIAETIPVRHQFVAQDAIGHYSFGYAGDSAARSETKSIDGVTRGAYSYVDGDGKLQSVEYTADALNGFQAAATNLPRSPIDNGMAPQQVQETEEVAKARAEHLAAFREAEARAAAAPENAEDDQSSSSSEQADSNGSQQGAAVPGQLPASTQVAAPGSIAIAAAPIAAVHAVPAVALRSFEGPVSNSYAYQVETNSPTYSYSVATPALYNTPASSYSYAAGPVIARSHVSLNGEFIDDRHFDTNGRFVTF